MYTRSYYPEQKGLTVPENYDGNAFSERISDAESNKDAQIQEEKIQLKAPWDIPKHDSEKKDEEVIAKSQEYDGVFASVLGKIPFAKALGNMNLFKKGLSDFGTEELLIIGIALFLLFSKSGDKECALVLLFLLFVK